MTGAPRAEQPPAAPTKPPTMADIARRAGVSRATVSFVLNNRDDRITEPTRRRVRAAAKALGYRPNLPALSLQAQRTATIGYVVAEDAADPFAGTAVAGALEVAWSNGSALLVVSTTREPERLRAGIEDLLDRRVDALLIAAIGTRSVTLPEVRHLVPTVLVNCYPDGRRLPCVLPDDYGGVLAAAGLLLDAGHRDIGYLAGVRTAWATGERVRAFRHALRQAGIDPRRQPLRYGNYHIDSGYELARRMLARGPLPTGLLCGNDRMALGAYLALAEAGVKVPEDVSIVGYDDHEELARDIHPGLSTVRLPYFEMGRWAAEQLFSGDVDRLPAVTSVPCPVVERQSVAPPRQSVEPPRQSVEPPRRRTAPGRGGEDQVTDL